MFKGLNWRAAFRKAAVLVVIYLAVLYVMDTAFPETAGIDRQALPGVALNTVIFFFVFSFVIAHTEKRRNRKQSEARKKNEPRQPEGSEDTEGSLKGKHNPNTSRKKAGRQARRRTRR